MDADVIFDQVRAQVPVERQAALRDTYQRAAKDGTAAFLTCYFLGLFGVHRMYLGDWRGAAMRLLIPLGLALVAVAGIVALAPREVVLAGLAGLLLVGLAWEGLDLLRIDHDVTQHNLALAQSLVRDPLASGNISRATPTRGVASVRRAPVPVSAPPAMPAMVAEPMPDLQPEMTQPETTQAETTQPLPAVASVAPAAPDVPVARPWWEKGNTDPLPAVVPTPEPASDAPPWMAPSFEQQQVPSVEPPFTPSVAEPDLAPSFATRLSPGATNLPAPYAAPDSQPRVGSNVEPGAAHTVVPSSATPPATVPEPARVPAAGGTPLAQPSMKRIRVRRRIVVDGQVVGEQVIEDLVPADMDTKVAAAALRARLEHMTPEQIAALAKLPPGVAVELRQSAGS